MGIYGFDHIVVRLEDFDAGVAAYSKLSGLSLRTTGENSQMGLKMAFFDLPNGGFIEIVAPTRPDSVLRPALDKNGTGMNLIAFQCEDLAATVKEMKGNGVRVIEDDPARIMVHPQSTHGILMQLVEKPKSAPLANKAGQVPDKSGVTGIVSYKCTLVMVKNVEEAISSYEKLGLKLTFKAPNKGAGIVQAIFLLKGGGLIELVGPLDPLDEKNRFVKFMKKRGEGFQHLSLDGSAGALDALHANGIKTKSTDPEHADIDASATLTAKQLFQLNPVLMGTKHQVNMGGGVAAKL
eukprot:gnl/TRDRNA2_/TRDRNA2_30658_c0_seq1.p1 gnl/TRDRNA2_/TRDRNA2_30658_c0~~gnl/TRDRNA2_/TRDRNA2_30658_c0_seq1.p1  ORF type:complete len:294 (-),score=65.68 gnl/TRDRNA2_/TRDRNA2_30658_c0_seq1:44-925(-)